MYITVIYYYVVMYEYILFQYKVNLIRKNKRVCLAINEYKSFYISILCNVIFAGSAYMNTKQVFFGFILFQTDTCAKNTWAEKSKQ